MANEDERLVVLLEARIRDFERNMKKAAGTSRTSFGQVEKDAKASAARLEKIYAGIGGGLTTALGSIAGAAGIGGLGLGALIASAKGATVEFAELAAQARRAGVSVEALQELQFAGAQSRVGLDALVDSLKELQIRADEFRITGAGSGAEALQRLGYDAAELSAKLEDPAALFEEIIDKLTQLDKASQIRVADEVFGGMGEQAVQFLDRGAGSIAKLRQEARDAGIVMDRELVQRAIQIDREFTKLSTTIGSNLKSALVSAVGLMRDFVDMLSSVENQSASTLQRRIELIDAAVANARKSSLAYGLIGGESGIASRIAERDQLQATLDSRPGTRVTVNPAPGGQGDLSKISTSASQAAEKLAESYRGLILAGQQRIAALNVETSTIGMATREAERYRFEQEAIAEAQSAGLTITSDQRAAISQLANAYGDAAASAEQAARSFDIATAAKADFAATGVQAVQGFISDLRQGATLTDALGNALSRLADRLIATGLESLLTPIFGAFGGSLPLAALGFGGFRAEGGPITAGKAYVTGERGPELIVPSRSGYVVPNHKLTKSVTGGAMSRQTVTIAPTITVAPQITVEGGSQGAQADQELAGRIGREVENMTRAVVINELMAQLRPGGLLWR